MEDITEGNGSGVGICEEQTFSIIALAVDGNADKFTPVVFKKMVSRLQIAGSGFLFLSFALILFRKPLQQHLHHSLTGISFSKFYRDTKHHISAAWTEVSPQHQFLFLIIFFIGVIIRICFLFQPMRHDEAFTFTNYASKPLFVALSNYSFPNNHLFHTFFRLLLLIQTFLPTL